MKWTIIILKYKMSVVSTDGNVPARIGKRYHPDHRRGGCLNNPAIPARTIGGDELLVPPATGIFEW